MKNLTPKLKRLILLQLLFITWMFESLASSPVSTNLKELKGDRFIFDLRYNSDDNFLKTNVYKKFGLDKCYVRPELEEKLQNLAKILSSRKLKLVLFDCYRPLEG